MHFPLHKGTEVLLTFIDGDPDRPIIASAVPNPATASPVNTENQSESVIKTGGDNKIRIEDREGSERIIMQSPKVKSFIRIGTPNDPLDLITVPSDIIYIVQNEALPAGWNTNYSVNPGFIEDPAVFDGASATDADRSTKKIKVSSSSSQVIRTTPGTYNIIFTVTEFQTRKDPVSGTWTWRALSPETYTRSVHVIEEQEKEFVKDVKEGDGIKIMTDGGIELYTGNPGGSLSKPQDINIMTDQKGYPQGDLIIEAYNIDSSCRNRSLQAITGNQASWVGGNTFEGGIGNSLSIKGGTENSILVGGKLEAGLGTKMEFLLGSSFELAYGTKFEFFKGSEYDQGDDDWKKHSDKSITIDAQQQIELIGGEKNNSKITGKKDALTIQFGQYGESIADNPSQKMKQYGVPTAIAHLIAATVGFTGTAIFEAGDCAFTEDKVNSAIELVEDISLTSLGVLGTAIALILYFSFQKKKDAVKASLVQDETHSEIKLDEHSIKISSGSSRIRVDKNKQIIVNSEKDDVNILSMKRNINLKSGRKIQCKGDIFDVKNKTFQHKNFKVLS